MAKNQSTEDYIKGIYQLQRLGSPVTTSALARLLGLGDGSVTGMIKKLSSNKLVRYEPYKGVSLTETGTKLALNMVRRHRLWEMFLVKYLGYKWDEIHDEAERLEHSTSDELTRRLDKLLGHPPVDPHGDPIPDVRGTLRSSDSTALSSFECDEVLRVVRVSDRHPDILHHATEVGLVLNRKLVIKKKMKFDGSLLLKIGSKNRFISQRMADAIFVERV
jgi:DtxR family Mn-dependent transcriptional regulator